MNHTIHDRVNRPNEVGDQNGSEKAGERCPECDGQIEHDDVQGEQVCLKCGLVLEEDTIDHGPEWRSFAEDGDERSRVGAPTTNLVHDKGLSTTIGWADTDAHGKRVDARKRPRLNRLRRWDERFRTKDSAERNLKQALGEIERMASALGLPRPCRETAATIYRRALDEDLLPGRSIEAMATASLYGAARQHKTPRTLTAFESVSRVEKLRIQRAYRYISKELGLAVEPADPVEYLPQIASPLGISEEVERRARELLEVAKKAGMLSGKAPAGLAAAAIYAAAQLTNESLTQEAVGESADVSAVTIRVHYQELLEAYGAQQNR